MARIFLIIAALFAAAGGASAAHAAPAPQVSANAAGLALGGYDPVAYFTAGRPVAGSAAHQVEWNGATWRFASAQSLEQFKASPERFAPQFGGYCAWATSRGYIAPGDPNQWKIVDGKLYVNFNAQAKGLWEADEAAAITRGHANWPSVLTNNQNS